MLYRQLVKLYIQFLSFNQYTTRRFTAMLTPGYFLLFIFFHDTYVKKYLLM